jgi:hypothetical protein
LPQLQAWDFVPSGCLLNKIINIRLFLNVRTASTAHGSAADRVFGDQPSRCEL